jgi:allantoin racemase
MGMKIAMISPSADKPGNEKSRQVAEKVFIKNANKLKEEGTVVHHFLLEKGFINMDHLSWESLSVWNDFEVFEAVRKLQGQDYDAVIINCFSDPHLYACRQIMDIPVIGVAQTSMLMASMMGPKFGVITFCQPYIFLVDSLIAKYGCKDLAVPTRSMDTTHRELVKSFWDAHDIMKKFGDFARQSIADGAEVLVPG